MEYILGTILGFLLGRFYSHDDELTFSSVKYWFKSKPTVKFHYGQEVDVIGGFNKGQTGTIDEMKNAGHQYMIQTSDTMGGLRMMRDYITVDYKDIKLTPQQAAKETKNYDRLKD